MGNFKFNGTSTEDLGLVIQTPPSYTFPERDTSSVHIPGRNGDLVIDNGCYKNVERSYSIAKAFKNNSQYYSNMERVLSWLTSSNGKYCRLEDSYDSEVYRMGTFVMGSSFTNYYDKAGAINVTFNCKPQRYLKKGEEPLKYKGYNIKVDNPSPYEALPIIELNNITVDVGRVTMMSVLDENDNVTSSVTINTTPHGHVIIDSEEKSVYDSDGTNLSYAIGLNGKRFPSLSGNHTKIKMEKYISEQSIIRAYDTIIKLKQEVCNSKYEPYDVLEENARQEVDIQSYKSMIESKQETYNASSQLYKMEKEGESYTIIPYDTLLQQYGDKFLYSPGPLENNPSWSKCEFLNFETITRDDNKFVRITAKKSGYFMTTNDTYIRRCAENSLIIEIPETNTNGITINYYEEEIIDGQPCMKIRYENLLSDWPEWLRCDITYNNDRTPIEISYKVNKEGYYWKDKTWWMGKSKWYYNTDMNTILDSFTWSSNNKSFGGSGTSFLGIGGSSTKTYIYSETVRQYEDTETSKCYFEVVDASKDLLNVTVKAKEEGYYAYSINNGEKSKWIKTMPGDVIILSVKTSTTFEIYRLDSIPDYSEVEDWPEWLNPNPIGNISNDVLNSSKITFMVNEESNYTYSYTDENGNKKKHEPYEHLVDGDLLSDIVEKSSDESYTIYKLDEEPETFENDRSCNGENWPEDYFVDIDYIYEDDTKPVEEQKPEDRTIIYTAGKEGFFRWDTNSQWVYKLVGETLLKTAYKDDTVIDYMSELPQYSEYQLMDLFKITPHETNGNPDSTIYTVLVPGYYRVNYNSDWKYYNENDTLLTSKITDENVIYHLKDTNELLTNVEFTIIPRWWML